MKYYNVYSEEVLKKAHGFSFKNLDLIKKSKRVGCFYCIKKFHPKEIKKWIEKHQTAVCPRCGIDSLIPSESGYPLTQEFLKQMSDRWFKFSNLFPPKSIARMAFDLPRERNETE